MTAQEHQLMVVMFAKQTQYIKVLVDLLKTKGIITPENQPAFDFSVPQGSVADGHLYQATQDSYRQAATALGLSLDASPTTR